MTETAKALELDDHQIVDSSFTAIINAPIDKIDLAKWVFALPEHEYQGCSPPMLRPASQPRLMESGCRSMSR